MSIVTHADLPAIAVPFQPLSIALLRATPNEIVWRQMLSGGVSNDLYYIGTFRYAVPGKVDGVTGTVTEVKGVINDEVVTFHWSDFSSPLDVMDQADMTAGGWDEFYRTTLLPGNDVITSSRSFAERLNGYNGDDTISSGSGPDYLRGDDGNDSISGGTNFDDINGNRGADTADGGAGDDWVLGGQDNDVLHGGQGSDLINGNLGSDTCDGGEGNDVVRGGKDDDVILGGTGDDHLFGDLGSDTLTGGEGADVFHVALENGRDVITDFNYAQGDRIRVDGDVDFRAAQVGENVRVTLIYGTVGVPYTTAIVIQSVNLSAMSDGWITH